MSKPKTKAYIALGSNVGNRRLNLRRAVDALSAAKGVTAGRVSRSIETDALGPIQNRYLNAVAEIETSLKPETLLNELMRIEKQLGRKRVRKWGPRIIDLDLLLYGDRVIDTDGLKVPHPRMHLRSFVLNGMCGLNGKLRHPVLNRTIAELAARLNGANFAQDPALPQLVAICGVIGVGKTTLAERLAGELGGGLVLESYDENPFLPEVHMGKHEFGLACQLQFLAARTGQLKLGVLEAGKTMVGDYLFDKELVYAAMLLKGSQLKQYKGLYRDLAALVTRPVLVIYLSDSAANCLSRIQRRGRPYEKKISMGFVRKMAGEYEKILSSWKACPVIRLDMRQFDCRSSSAVKKLAEEVRWYL